MAITPTNADVLSGRGKPIASHPGNVIFRDASGLFYDAYQNGVHDKKKISHSVKLIFDFAGARFLKKKESKFAKELKKAAKKNLKPEIKKNGLLDAEWRLLEESEILAKINQRFTMEKYQKKSVLSDNKPNKPNKRPRDRASPLAARKKRKTSALQEPPSAYYPNEVSSPHYLARSDNNQFELCLGAIIKDILDLAQKNSSADYQQLARVVAKGDRKETSALKEAVNTMITLQGTRRVSVPSAQIHNEARQPSVDETRSDTGGDLLRQAPAEISAELDMKPSARPVVRAQQPNSSKRQSQVTDGVVSTMGNSNTASNPNGQPNLPLARPTYQRASSLDSLMTILLGDEYAATQAEPPSFPGPPSCPGLDSQLSQAHLLAAPSPPPLGMPSKKELTIAASVAQRRVSDLFAKVPSANHSVTDQLSTESALDFMKQLTFSSGSRGDGIWRNYSSGSLGTTKHNTSSDDSSASFSLRVSSDSANRIIAATRGDIPPKPFSFA